MIKPVKPPTHVATSSAAAAIGATALVLVQCSTGSSGVSESVSPRMPVDASSADAGSCSGGLSADGAAESVGPYDSRLTYTGRVDLSDPRGPWLIASATYVSARFGGSSVSVQVDDQPAYPGGSDFFDVIIDDLTPFVLTLGGVGPWYDLTPRDDAGVALALSSCDHTLTLIKRTEATVGISQVTGFRFAAASPAPPPDAPVRRIEIIGDSIACGAGIQATSPEDGECLEDGVGNAGFGQGVQDGYLAFGTVMARSLGAEWHLTCESGVGLVRNVDNGFIDPRPMPVIYPYLHPEDPTNVTLWPPTQWAANGVMPIADAPDVIVVELGGNDLSTSTADGGSRPPILVGTPSEPPDGTPTLVSGLIAFIAQLETDHPGATIVLTANAAEVETAMQIVVGDYGDGGAGAGQAYRVYAVANGLPFPGAGCAGHPNAAQQASAASIVAAYVKQVMGW